MLCFSVTWTRNLCNVQDSPKAGQFWSSSDLLGDHSIQSLPCKMFLETPRASPWASGHLSSAALLRCHRKWGCVSRTKNVTDLLWSKWCVCVGATTLVLLHRVLSCWAHPISLGQGVLHDLLPWKETFCCGFTLENKSKKRGLFLAHRA